MTELISLATANDGRITAIAVVFDARPFAAVTDAAPRQGT